MNDMPSTAISAVRMMPTTQTQIDVFSDQMIESVKSGEANPLEVLHIFKSLEKAQERILKEIKDNILSEAGKYPEKTFEFHGAKLTKTEVGVTYDFKVCGDPVHDQRESIMNAAKNLLDERKEFLKSLKEPITTVDEGSGEVVTIRPPLKKSTSTVTVSIK
jgi:hypothetical protein